MRSFSDVGLKNSSLIRKLIKQLRNALIFHIAIRHHVMIKCLALLASFIKKLIVTAISDLA